MNRADAILLEDMNHKLDTIMEGQAAMAPMIGDVAQLKEDMVEVKGEIQVIKRAVKDRSREITEIKHALAI